MTEREQRHAVVREAMSWMGTPFHHMARVKGIGVDCGQILAAVYETTGNIRHVDTTPYSMQHALHSNDEWYIRYLEQFSIEIPERLAREGDIAIYRVGRVYSHAGILIEPWPGKIIHAVNGAGVIVSHGTKEGFLKKHPKRRFFTKWPPSLERPQSEGLRRESMLGIDDFHALPTPEVHEGSLGEPER